MSVVEQIYKLRRDFILIGLTGRTGSGCSSVAKILSTEHFSDLRMSFREINTDPWDNDSRKNRIVHNYMQKHWHPFQVIHASNVIFYYALKLDFESFIHEFSAFSRKFEEKEDQDVRDNLQPLEKDYLDLQKKVNKCEEIVNSGKETSEPEVSECLNVITTDIAEFRKKLSYSLHKTKMRIYSGVLQRWGNNIRSYDSVIEPVNSDISPLAPACLAHKINQFIKIIRKQNKAKDQYTHIVIDALRNPYEVLFFRERYSAFYLMSINTDEKVRRDKLIEKGYDLESIKSLDEKESDHKKDFIHSYQEIDIDKCIELADIYVTHDGSDYTKNRELNNQIVTYLSLIRHPGLIPPSPMERVMQVAFTAKLNSGCLSRQVGAVVTNESYSIQAVGWNTVAQGQTPCSLRCISDLCRGEDTIAYSAFEKQNSLFHTSMVTLNEEYKEAKKKGLLLGLPDAYCFKDIHTRTAPNQRFNQVHTRALHAEENAFLQLAKYGTEGVVGGKLFTTSSCCELCGKKAYQLGIHEIIYIDSYPGITRQHIIECGDSQPKMVLFHGVIGRAYTNLYNPFVPFKDELEALSGISVKRLLDSENGKDVTEDSKN